MYLIFQSTLSMRRATLTTEDFFFCWDISIHALHEESDANMRDGMIHGKFQSTLSMRRATYVAHNGIAYDYISIHALHEESDLSFQRRIKDIHYFNPRSP